MSCICPYCERELELSEDSSVVLCPECGKEIDFSDAETKVNTSASNGETEGENGGQGVSSTDGKRSQIIGGYEILDLLGKGGMAAVYRARQLSLNREVAVKVLPRSLARQEEFVQRFNREAEMMAKLIHPNIVQVIDRGVEGDLYYFVMEFVDGRGLDGVLREGRLTLEEKLQVVVEVCKGLAYAHEQGIVHRDIKPSNILVNRRGLVKIADFGIAGILRKGEGGEEEGLTRTGVGMGTLRYMAPEQKCDAKNVDHRADIYALGVMIYEMLTGEYPVGRFPMPSQVCKGLDSRLDMVVDRCLQFDPQKRFDNVLELAGILEEVLRDWSGEGPTQVGRMGGRELVSSGGRGRSWWWLGLVLLLLLGGVGGVGFALGWERVLEGFGFRKGRSSGELWKAEEKSGAVDASSPVVGRKVGGAVSTARGSSGGGVAAGGGKEGVLASRKVEGATGKRRTTSLEGRKVVKKVVKNGDSSSDLGKKGVQTEGRRGRFLRLLKEAERYLSRGEGKRALELYERLWLWFPAYRKGLERGRKLARLWVRLREYMRLGQGREKAREYGEAEGMYRKALGLARRIRELSGRSLPVEKELLGRLSRLEARREEFKRYFSKAEELRMAGKYKAALGWYRRAGRVIDGRGSLQWRKSLEGVGEALCKAQKFGLALEFYRLLERSSEGEVKRKYGEKVEELGLILENLKKVEAARSASLSESSYKRLTQKAIAYERRGDLKKALELYEGAYRRTKDRRLLAPISRLKEVLRAFQLQAWEGVMRESVQAAERYERLGQNERALEAYLKALLYAKKLGDREEVAKLQKKVGRLERKLGRSS
ncbi:MAG: serine/threonine protein kinase [Planctomycetota bacterium]|nr:MAG: serine/threonine protein kinase [Planctomycetota bacterium]